jgi:sodium transport system permease protein
LLGGAIGVLRKELRETLRDRSLVIQLVLIPLFLYPLLGFGAWQVLLIARGAEQARPLVIWADARIPSDLHDTLTAESDFRVIVTPDSIDSMTGSPTIAAFREARRRWDRGAGAPPVALLSWWSAKDGVDSAAVFFDGSRERSERAQQRLVGLLQTYRTTLIRQRAAAFDLTEIDLEPWPLQPVDLATARQMGGYILSLVLPVFLMIMLPQGTYYATLDTIVGERERGTWETLLSTPLTRGAILLGKLAYVVIWSLVAFSLNLLSLSLVLRFALSLAGDGLQIELGVDPVGLLMVIPAALLLAVVLASIMMAVAVSARSYREGQATLSPIYLVAAFSPLFALVGQERFTVTQALIPILNVTAMLKTALRGELEMVPSLVALSVLLGLAIACLVVASRLIRDENIWFEQQPSLRRLLTRGFGRD